MRLLYTKPELKDLSQGSRITFVRQFRLMTQDEVLYGYDWRMHKENSDIV